MRLIGTLLAVLYALLQLAVLLWDVASPRFRVRVRQAGINAAERATAKLAKLCMGLMKANERDGYAEPPETHA